jgi:FAD/FMN-containing dehydrogenase
MNPTPDIPISNLRANLNGNVIALDDPGYDDARRVFFTGFDRRPAAIVRVADASDVSRTVNLARETGAELAVRSGGHSRAGFGTSEGGIVLDLSEMNAVEIGPESRTAWAQTGITAGGYTKAAGEHGLATGLGDTASVGVGGITLGGGIGFLVRKHGLTIDDVLGGMLMLPASAEVIVGLVAAAEAAPEELSVIANVMKAPPLPFVPAEQHGKPVVMARMVYAGDAEAGERAIAPIRALATPLADMVRPIRYPEIYEKGPRPAIDGGTNVLVDGLVPGAGETILEHLEASTAQIPVAQLRVLGGAVARVPDDATAFGYRGARLMVNVTAMDDRPEKGPEHKAWARSLATALSDGAAAAYVGFLGDEGEQGVRRAYPPATLDRLAQVKRQYDPDDLFRLNENIRPAEA